MRKIFVGMCLLVFLNSVDVLGTERAAKKLALPVVEIKTSLGNIKVELFQEKAPLTVKNF